jgi:ABC-2 type transport system permease protein
VSGRGDDRGAWRLVARRDFWVRLRERSFLVSTLINLAVISILIVLRAVSGGGSTPDYTVGVVGSNAVAEQLSETPDVAGVHVDVRPFDDAASAEEALRDGDVDAMIDDERIVGFHAVAAPLQTALEAAAVSVNLVRTLDRLGATNEQIDSVANSAPLTVAVLEPGDPNRNQNAAIAFIGVLLLYGQLFGYGVWVASGVIEEKASRVVEILLSTIRARQLMAGKIVGIGTLGLAQLAFIATFAIALALGLGAIDLPGSAIGAALLVLGFFVLGFAFYASLFAVAGSLVSRMEELQNAIVPINLVILVSFFVSIGALQNPDGTLVRVASLLPTSSALAMPVRIVLGSAAPWEVAVSIGASVLSVLLLVPLAGRLYAGAVLRTGARVRLRDAWRAGR